MPHDIFISYATEDKRTADAVCAAIEARGYRCWMAPRDVVPGMPYGEAIIKAIQGCRAMVLVFSSHANASSHIPKEVERAVTRDLAIIPFRIEDVPPSDRLDYFISSLHWLDAIGGAIDSHTARLADVVEQTLAGDGASVAKSSAQRLTLWGKISSLPAAAMDGIRGLGRRALLLAVGCSLAVGLIATIAVWNLKPAPAPQPKPVTRAVITLPADQKLAVGDNPAIAISPDGRLLAYVAVQGTVQQLYLRAIDSLEAKAIPGTDGAVNPFFSPDSQSLGFFAEGKLKKVSVNGGGATTLGDAARPRGGSWGNQGSIVFTPSIGGPVQQVPEGGGTAKSLTQLAEGDTSHRWPEFLPNGKAVLFASGFTATGMSQVAVQVTGTGEQRILVPVQGTQPRYAASGHLLYVQGSTLMAAPFDVGRQTLTGEAVPVVENVQRDSGSGAAQYGVSATGSLVYVSGGSQANQSRMVWVSRDGKEQPLATAAHVYGGPRLSPDGRRVVVEIAEQGTQLWLYDLSRDTLTRLTFEGNHNIEPAWTPDGKRIAFSSDKEGQPNLFWQLADGSGGLERLTTSEYSQAPGSWSSDGQLLAFREISPITQEDLWVLRMGDRKAQPFLRTPFNESVPRFSPDGRWLAYVSNESGRNEIYTQPYPGPGGRYQISAEGGTEPVWSRNGRELFFRSGDKLMAVDIATQPGFTVGKPRMLFEGPYLKTRGTHPLYDVSPDGQRFLMLKPVEPAQAINVVLNWFEELKQKVPGGKN